MIVETALIASLCTFIVLERLVNASVVLATRLAYGTEKGDTGVKGYAGVQVLGAWATYASTVGGALVSLLSTLLAGLASYLLWALTITVVFSLLFIAQEYYPEILVQFVDYYNQFIGPKLHTIVVVPAEIVDTVFSALVPIYDTAVWWFSQFFYNVIVTGAIRDFQPWRDLGVAVAKLFEAVSISFVDYVFNLAQGCPRPVTDQCFAPGPRTLDLITPMIPVRDAAVASSQILDGLCKGLTGPTDIATYPLVDINLAKGIHNTVNGVLFLFIQIWDIRTQRCAAHQNDLILCLPDFEPAFNFLCAGIRNFGVLLDNWFDVSSIIVQVCAPAWSRGRWKGPPGGCGLSERASLKRLDHSTGRCACGGGCLQSQSRADTLRGMGRTAFLSHVTHAVHLPLLFQPRLCAAGVLGGPAPVTGGRGAVLLLPLEHHLLKLELDHGVVDPRGGQHLAL